MTNQISRAAAATYFIVAVIGIFVTLPVAVNFFQPQEFNFSVRDIALLGAMIAAPIGVLGIVLCLLRPSARVVMIVAQVIIVYICLFCFVLPVPSGEQLGSTVVTFNSDVRNELLIHLIVVAAIALILMRARESTSSLAFALACVCVGFPVYASVVAPPSKLADLTKQQDLLDDFATLSGKRTILVVLFDELRGQLVKDTLEGEPALKNSFPGFTFFTEANSASPRTAMSLPNILSSSFYPGGNAQDWMDKATSRDGFLTDAFKAGYNPRYLQTMGAPCGPVPCLPSTSFSGLSPWTQLSQEYVATFRLSLMRILPTVVHPKLDLPHMTAIASNVLPLETGSGSSLTEPEQHLASLQGFTRDLRVDQNLDHRLVFMHITFTHLPVDFDKTCKFNPKLGTSLPDVMQEVRCGVGQMTEITKRLQDLGVYDNTAILFISDHGENTLYYHSDLPPSVVAYVPGEEEHYHPTIMFKPFGATGSIKYSVAPAALIDVRKTICVLMEKCEQQESGEDLAKLPEDSQRIRKIMHFRYGKGLSDESGAYPTKTYHFIEFTGRFENLKRAIFKPHQYKIGQNIDFRDGGNGVGYTFTGWSVPQSTGLWSDARDGDTGQIELDFPQKPATPLTLTAEVEAYVKTQKVDVIVNYVTLGTWTISAGGNTEIMSVDVPADVASKQDPMNIQFKPYAPVTPSDLSNTTTDARKLGLLLINMKLQPKS